MKVIVQLILIICANILHGQTFTAVSGPITNTPSDSRSVNFIDVNNDDWVDVFISNGAKDGQKDLLYINDGSGSFELANASDITDALNPSDGASFADYNNDGHVDGIVSSWYGKEDLLYINDGEGMLNYKNDAGIALSSYGETAVFIDYNNDNWLDIYVTNSGDNRKNFLYENQKDGSFKRITNHLLVQDAKLSRAAIWTDLNSDGLFDIMVANEENSKNDVFFNMGEGIFEKQQLGDLVNLANGSITISTGDIDNDGDIDIFVGNSGYTITQKDRLYINDGNGAFTVRNQGALSEANTCSFGSAFGDYDNDGDLDLFVSSGFCNNALQNNLYENQGDGQFVKVSSILTDNKSICSFGAAWGDVNNNGFLDLIIANCKNQNATSEQKNSLLINSGNENNWLKIKLIGVVSNKDAIGAKLTVISMIDGKEVHQIREISAQSGYAGQNEIVAHFGLRGAEFIDSLIIQWPSGIIERKGRTESNQLIKIVEGLTLNINQDEIQPSFDFKFYPNPISTKDEFGYFELPSNLSNQKVSLALYNNIGNRLEKEMSSMRVSGDKIRINFINLNLIPGMYFLEITGDKDRVLKKIRVM